MKEKIKKKGYLYAIIGVCILIITIIGSSYAYFVASSTSGTVAGKTLSVGLKIPPQTGDPNSPGISLVSNTGTKGNGLIPIYDGTVAGHASQMSTAVSASKNCVDSNNYTVCHIYKVKIMNTGDDAISVDTTVSLNKGGSTNLKWASMTNANTFGSIEPAKLASGVNIAANSSVDQYLVIYISNTGADQTTPDSSKNYSFTVTATASTGQQVQATFGDEGTYNMMSGSATTVSAGANAKFRSDAELSKFEGVTVDGNTVSSSNYTTESGSTVVKLKKEYISTLANGNHEIKIISSDGYAKSNFEKVNAISFTIKGNTYYATPGMNWAEWILSTVETTSGNNIVWVGLDNSTMYVDIGGHTSSNIPTEILKDSSGNTQRVGSIIQANMAYNQDECCFDAGSQVLMSDKTTKNIEDVKVGDYVMSYDTKTGEYAPQKVTHTIIKHNSDDLVYLNLSNGVRIGMRAYHPMLTVNGWKSLRPELAETISDVGHIQKLELNDTLIGINKNVNIVSIDKRNPIDNYDTYNLTVNNFHSYIVNGVVVHNASCPV